MLCAGAEQYLRTHEAPTQFAKHAIRVQSSANKCTELAHHHMMCSAHRRGKGSANERTRTTITAGLKKKLKELMGEFSEMRNRIQEEYREVVERRVYTVTGAQQDSGGVLGDGGATGVDSNRCTWVRVE
eukprot:scaffold261904_cov28-Tisochrysis_lutea.AAC.1